MLTIVLLKETAGSEYREQLIGKKGRHGKEDKFLLCHSEEDMDLHNRDPSPEYREISAEHLSTRFGSPSILKQ